MNDWKDVLLGPDDSLRRALQRLESTAARIVLVVDEVSHLLGTVTDGDIRRGLLAGIGIEAPVNAVMNSFPAVASVDTNRDEALKIMKRLSILNLPIVDAQNQLVGLHQLAELIGTLDRPNWVVLMAGGLGTRLQPLTNECPKPLLTVGGKPILESIIQSFSQQGFRRIFISVNYKADMICNHFGSGERWGVRVEYLHETSRLGTGGALSLLPEKPPGPIIVMNGDLLTNTNFDSFLQFHQSQGALATMALREYDFQVPYGVVKLDGVRITAIEEKPVQKFMVNAGIYALAPEFFGYLPKETAFDMTSLLSDLIIKGENIAAYPLSEYWLDIGRLEEFERAQIEWKREL